MSEKNVLQTSLNSYQNMQKSLTDYEEMALLSEEDEDMQAEIEKLRAQLAEKDGSSKTE